MNKGNCNDDVVGQLHKQLIKWEEGSNGKKAVDYHIGNGSL